MFQGRVTGDETSLTNRSDRAERRCKATALEGRKEGSVTNVQTEKLSSKLLDDNRMQRQGATSARPGAGVCRVPARDLPSAQNRDPWDCLVSWSVAQADLVTVCCRSNDYCPKRKRPPRIIECPRNGLPAVRAKAERPLIL